MVEGYGWCPDGVVGKSDVLKVLGAEAAGVEFAPNVGFGIKLLFV